MGCKTLSTPSPSFPARSAGFVVAQLVARAARRPPISLAKDSSLSGGGFGAEVREAMDRRVDHLVEEGLARRQGQRVIFARDLIDTLGRRDLE